MEITPEDMAINRHLNIAFRLIAQTAADDVLRQDRERIKKELMKLESFNQGVVPLEDAMSVVDNELAPFPNKSDPRST